MPKKRNGGSFVTRTECDTMMGQVGRDIDIVKKALVGDDFRHGIVKDVADIKSQMIDFKNTQKEKRETSLRWKLAAAGFAFTLLGILLQEVLSHL